MCRLLYATPDSSILELHDWTRLLNHLRKECGGHGEGYAVIDASGEILAHKRHVNLGIAKAAKALQRATRDGHYAIWHTRLVSVGGRTNRNCHPHPIDGGYFRGVLAHNGTDRTHGTLARWLGYRQGGTADMMSDTASVAYLYGKMGEDAMREYDLWPSTGVWLTGGIHQEDGNPRHQLRYYSGDLGYLPSAGLWASSFTGWMSKESYTPKHGLHMASSIPDKKPALIYSKGKKGKTYTSGSMATWPDNHRYLPTKYRVGFTNEKK